MWLEWTHLSWWEQVLFPLCHFWKHGNTFSPPLSLCTPLKQCLIIWMNTQWEKPEEYSMFERWFDEQIRLQDQNIAKSQDAIKNTQQDGSTLLQQQSLSTAVRYIISWHTWTSINFFKKKLVSSYKKSRLQSCNVMCLFQDEENISVYPVTRVAAESTCS